MAAILDSPLMGEFIAFLKSNCDSRVDQRRRRLKKLVALVSGIADAVEDRAALRGSSLKLWFEHLRREALRGQDVLNATSDATSVAGVAKKMLARIKMLFVCSAEVNRLAQAVEELERLAGDLKLFVKVLQLDDAMVLDEAPVACTEEEGITSWVMSANSSPAMLPTPGIKRKRAGSSSVGYGEGDSTLHGPADMLVWQKRRVLAWRQFPSSGALSAASRRPPVRRRRAAQTRTSAQEVAMAMVKVRGRIGKPARRRPPAGSLARTDGSLRILGQRFSRIFLQ